MADERKKPLIKGQLSPKLELLGRLTRKRGVIRVFRNSVILRSIRKSGTNFLRLFLTNYVRNLDPYQEKGGEGFERISYDRMQEIFPNVRAYVWGGKTSYKEPDRSAGALFFRNYSDLLYDHGCLLDRWRWARGRKTILLYRNPLDHVISLYHYGLAQGEETVEEGLERVFEERLDAFLRDYSFMKRLHKETGPERSIMLPYETLYLQPHATFSFLLHFLEIPRFPELISKAVEASGQKEVRKEEAEKGEAIHQPGKGLSGSFVRSGAVGQWKSYFDERKLRWMEGRMKEKGVSLKEFSFEPSDHGI